MSLLTRLGGAAALAAAFGVSGAAYAEVVRHALIVGANDGGLELDPLRYAESDAARMASVLTELGDFDPSNITLLNSPTAFELDVALRNLTVQGEETLFLFYYSGHSDAQGLRLREEVYPFDTLKEHVRAVDADVTLGVLDSCRSGAITQLKGATVVTPFLGSTLDAEGEAWITASSATEKAQESERLEGSFFTHYLVSGLRGAAANGDGRVSLNEAYAYAYEHTVSDTVGTDGGTQHPEYDFKLQGKGDLDLTVLSRATSKLRLPVGVGGRVVILSEPSGALVAEVAKREDEELVLALPPGTYRVRRRDGAEVYEVRMSLADEADWTLDRWGSATTEIAGWKGPQTPELPEIVGPMPAEEGGFERTLDESREAIDGLVEETRSTSRQILTGGYPLNASPRLAGGASLLMPGAGQVYNGQWGRGGLYFVSSAALVGTGFAFNTVGEGAVFNGGITGPTALSLIGFGIWGLSISQSQSFYAEGYDDRPITGLTLAVETAWWHNARSPYSSGLALDYILRPNVSVGLDRTGWTRAMDGDGGMVSLGGRVMVAPEWDRLRPGLFFASGLRIGAYHPDQHAVRPVFGMGTNIRYYLGPRYFVNYELRYERDSGLNVWTNGGGIGVHFGG